MTNENGKALRLFKLHCQRGNLPIRAQRLLDVKYLLRIGGFVLLYELMQIGAKRVRRTLRWRGHGLDYRAFHPFKKFQSFQTF